MYLPGASELKPMLIYHKFNTLGYHTSFAKFACSSWSPYVVTNVSLFLFADHQLRGKSGLTDIELNWTNYKSASNSPFSGNSPKLCHRQRPSTSSLPADTYLNSCSSPQSPASPPTPPLSVPSSPLPNPSPTERRRCTPPPTPPLVKPNTTKGKFPTTPPPHKRNKLFPEPFRPITKSKSHESQLAMRVTQDQDISKWVGITGKNSLWPSDAIWRHGSGSLPEPMLTQFPVTIWRHWGPMS